MTYSLTHSTFRVIDCEAAERILRLSRDSCDLQFPLMELMVSSLEFRWKIFLVYWEN